MLTGKVAVITGAASGIGEATARLFSKEGATVVIADIDQNGAALADELGQQGETTLFIHTDVTDETSVKALFHQTADTFGRLDILVANAGIPEKKCPVHEVDMADWQRVIDINLKGTVLCNKYAATEMLKQGSGSIINMASILGHKGQENNNAYSSAKAAIVNFTRSVALTYARQGIRANCVAPGYVETPLLALLPKETTDTMLQKQPIGRLAQPIEIAHVIAFLASDKSSIITGASINADGGCTAA